MFGIDTGFKMSPTSYNIGHTTQGLCEHHQKKQNQRSK